MDRAARLRAHFAGLVARRGGATDPRIETAFAAVPREPFAGPPPWLILAGGPRRGGDRRALYLQTPDGDPAYLYQDVLVALDADAGINIGEPSLHARCLDALGLQAGETVLHVGAGSGYYTAILAELVGPSGRVHAFEIAPELAARAERNLADFPHITVEPRSGVASDLPEADAIYVNAGLTQPEAVWLDALAPGGRLMVPLQPEGGFGGMIRIDRPRDAEATAPWPARFVSRAGFIGCRTPQDAATGSALAEAFAKGGLERVRSLRRGTPPDATAWVVGEGWWLSTDDA